jgi:sugar lactone lactonase YvrE
MNKMNKRKHGSPVADPRPVPVRVLAANHPAGTAPARDGFVVCMYDEGFVNLFGGDGTDRVFPPPATAGVPKKMGRPMRPRTVAVSRDGTTVLVNFEGAGLYELDLDTGAWTLTYATEDTMAGVAFSRDFVYVVKTGDGRVGKGQVVRLERCAGGGVVETVVCGGLTYPQGIAVSKDGSFALVTSSLNCRDRLCMLRVDLRTGEVSKPFERCRGMGPVFGVALSPDETSAYVTGTDHASIVRVDLRKGGVCESVYTHQRGFYGVALDPDGSHLVATTWGQGGCVTFIDMAAGDATGNVSSPGASGAAAAPGAGSGAAACSAAVASTGTVKTAVKGCGGTAKKPRGSDRDCGFASPAAAPLGPGVVPAISSVPAAADAAACATPAVPAAAAASALPTGQEFVHCASELQRAKRACATAVRAHGEASTQHVAAAERLRRAREWANDLRSRLENHQPQLTALLSQPPRSRKPASK